MSRIDLAQKARDAFIMIAVCILYAAFYFLQFVQRLVPPNLRDALAFLAFYAALGFVFFASWGGYIFG